MHRFDQRKDSRGYLYDARVTLGPRKKIKDAWISGKFYEENAASRICLYNINDATRPCSEWSDQGYMHGTFLMVQTYGFLYAFLLVKMKFPSTSTNPYPMTFHAMIGIT